MTILKAHQPVAYMYNLTSDVTSTVEPQYNKPLYNEILSITSDFL